MNLLALGILRSRLCTQSQFDDPAYAEWCAALDSKPRYHRKQWEFVYIAQSLAQAGKLQVGKRGIGFGVGREPLPALFAAHDVEVLATDAPAGGTWRESNQYAASLAALPWQGICSRAAFEELVQFEAVDMKAIPVQLRRGEFDFAWSACSLDHLGTLAAGLDFIRNSLACVKPGGVVVHTTEYNLSSNDLTLDRGWVVLYRQRDLEAFAAEMQAAGHEMALDLVRGDGPHDRFVDRPPYASPVHLCMEIGGFVTTSVGLTIRKGGA